MVALSAPDVDGVGLLVTGLELGAGLTDGVSDAFRPEHPVRTSADAAATAPRVRNQCRGSRAVWGVNCGDVVIGVPLRIEVQDVGVQATEHLRDGDQRVALSLQVGDDAR